jgi:hypothetical protein
MCDYMRRSRTQDAKDVAKQEQDRKVAAGSGYNTKSSGLANGTKSSGAQRLLPSWREPLSA